MRAVLRLPSQDKQKSLSKIKEEYEKGITCVAADCTEYITTFTGPGSNKLCREHQLQLTDYGGLGKIDRPWTFSRDWSCAWCGYSPKDDPWFKNPPIPWESEVHLHGGMRSTLVGDHSHDLKSNGGGHGKDNVQTLCQNCNAKKTTLYKDSDSSKSARLAT